MPGNRYRQRFPGEHAVLIDFRAHSLLWIYGSGFSPHTNPQQGIVQSPLVHSLLGSSRGGKDLGLPLALGRDGCEDHLPIEILDPFAPGEVGLLASSTFTLGLTVRSRQQDLSRPSPAGVFHGQVSTDRCFGFYTFQHALGSGSTRAAAGQASVGTGANGNLSAALRKGPSGRYLATNELPSFNTCEGTSESAVLVLSLSKYCDLGCAVKAHLHPAVHVW